MENFVVCALVYVGQGQPLAARSQPPAAATWHRRSSPYRRVERALGLALRAERDTARVDAVHGGAEVHGAAIVAAVLQARDVAEQDVKSGLPMSSPVSPTRATPSRLARVSTCFSVIAFARNLEPWAELLLDFTEGEFNEMVSGYRGEASQRVDAGVTRVPRVGPCHA